MPHDLIKLLERFNRKERYFLVGDALGNLDFCLSDDFRRRLKDAIELERNIPECAFAAMDYHIDWVVGALKKYTSSDGELNFPNKANEDGRLVAGNQEDVDLLVAFRDASRNYHLIFLEAKAYSGWNSKQMRSKAKRLDWIFKEAGERYGDVTPHFCLMSPSPPVKLETNSWPDWWLKSDSKEIKWLELKVPGKRLKVTRWNGSEDRASQNGSDFRVVSA